MFYDFRDLQPYFQGFEISGSDLNKSDRKFLLLSLTAVLILELFPLKSTGSFFSTHNSTYIFILISFILNYKNILISSKKN